MIDEQPIEHRFDRRWVWCGLIALAGLAATLIRVPTRLGVQVPETRLPEFSPSLIDLAGHEHIWRVWWRARDDFLSFRPQWLLTAALAVLLVVFAAGVLCLVWFALTPGPEPAETAE